MKKPFYKRWIFWAIVIVVGGIIGLTTGNDDPAEQAAPAPTEEAQPAVVEPTAEASAGPTAVPIRISSATEGIDYWPLTVRICISQRTGPDTDTYFQSQPNMKGYNLLHLNAAYDLCNRLYVDAIVQPRRLCNEGKARNGMRS
ncbi:hypothetical protein [Paenibacillus sp. 22594]|uniref:hypothetical protein n=1 Tax=Paenibacillus sp. 22594 TaxID=3453947 RepID=UPI003F843246